MLEPFDLPFMQRAALEVGLLAPIAGLLGAQIVLRRLAFFTHAVGTAAFPGLVVAGPAGIPPTLAAFAVGGGFAALLERLGHRPGVARDAATALGLVTALAVGVILASDLFESGAGVDRLLFGSLLAVGRTELLVSAGALLATLLAAGCCRRRWIAAGFDDVPAGGADLVLLATVALAAVAAIDAVGALLVSAVLVVPAATVRLFAPSIARLEIGTAALALAEGLAGLAIAFELDAPPGAVVAVLGGAIFVLAFGWRVLAGGAEGAPA